MRTCQLLNDKKNFNFSKFLIKILINQTVICEIVNKLVSKKARLQLLRD